MKNCEMLFLIIVVIIVTSSCSNCGDINMDPDGIMEECVTGVNTMQGGYIAKQGDWVFYSNPGRNFGLGKGLYRIRNDGSGKKRIVSGDIKNIITKDGWIYFVRTSQNHCTTIRKYDLYKVKPDGTSLSLVIENADSVNIIGDTIYYRFSLDVWGYLEKGKIHTLLDQSGYLYKSKIDGSESQQLSTTDEGYVTHYLIKDEWIYYSLITEGEDAIYQISTDGSVKKNIYTGDILPFFALDDKYVYLLERDWINSCNRMVSVGIKEKGTSTIVEDIDISATGLIATNGSLLYEDQFGAYILSKDDLQKKTIFKQFGFGGVYIYSDRLYYFDKDDKVCSIKFSD